MKNLKKIISEIIFSLIFGTSVFAEISFGANLKGGTGVGAVRAGDFENAFGTTDSILNITFGFDLNAQFGFKIGTQDFFVRPEFSMLFNNGLGNGFCFTYDDHSIGTSSDSDCGISVTTIDIPVYFGYKHSVGEKIFMEYFMGPYLSFPVYGKIETDAKDFFGDFAKPVLGAAFGLDCGIKAGKGAIILGTNYMFDFVATKLDIDGKDELIYARRNISINAGYRFIF